VGINAPSKERKEYLKATIGRLAALLKWPVDANWVNCVAIYLDDAIPKIVRRGGMTLGDLKTKYGMIHFVKGMKDSGCPVYGAARKDMLPYDVTVALDAGPSRSALALVHELLHCVDYTVKSTQDHTLLHNMAAVIESEALQPMGGYYGK